MNPLVEVAAVVGGLIVGAGVGLVAHAAMLVLVEEFDYLRERVGGREGRR